MTSVDRRTWLKGAGAGTLLTGLAGALAADERSGKAAKPRIKVGQIGVGHGHATKLSVFRESPDYEVVGVVEPDTELRAKMESQPAFRGVPWMTQEQLLNVPGLQVVLAETRVRDLLDTAEAAIAAGKHVHLDKPAGVSLPQFQRLLKKAEAEKLVVQMGYMYRYSPAVILLRQMLERGWLGEVFEIHTVMSKVVAPSERVRLAQFPGGMMLELGCHIIDLVVGVMGKPKGVTPFIQHASAVADGLADNTLAVLEYPRAIATVKSSALEVDGGNRRHFVVCGTEGTFHIEPLDNPAARVALTQPRAGYKRGYQAITFPRFDRYVADAADLARMIRGEKANDFTYAHDLAVQETVLRASNQSLTS